ncbi:MAG: helix-turn-helix transcriptional regulator [Rhizobiaceae bacterium]|nr:helix-turn-helix transcriptional regulator [Rhizobiaceae bacterium]
MDKRDLSAVFRDRLRLLVRRSGMNHSAFSASVGIDRSALSQLLSGGTTRLPRAETLLNIAETQKVSLDWLLGLSQDETLTGEIRDMLEIEQGVSGYGESFLARWYAEAAGSKVRYVPAGIPDLLRTGALVDYEAGITQRDPDKQASETRDRIDYNRRPETDMEVCMPRHTLEIFARGMGVWSGFPASSRKAQLRHMARLLDELYPTFRVFMYDGRARYSVPYTIFGSTRAAIYVGDMYLVLNGTMPIRTLTAHFDNLIRSAVVNPHETAAYAARLADDTTDAPGA